MVGGVPSQPLSLATLPPFGSPNPQLMTALKQLSAARYGRPRAEVEKDIFKRLETKPVPKKPGLGLPAGGAGRALPAARPGAKSAAKPGSSSFLDDWLAKKRKQSGAKQGAVVAPANTNTVSSAGDTSSVATVVNEAQALDTPPSNNQISIADSQSIQQSTSQSATGQQPVLSDKTKTVIPLPGKDNNFDLSIEQNSAQPQAAQEDSVVQTNISGQNTSLPPVAPPVVSPASTQAPPANQFQSTQRIAQDELPGSAAAGQPGFNLGTPAQVSQPVDNGNSNGLSQINIDQHGNLRSSG